MTIEDYKQIIIKLIEKSSDFDYIVAVCTFAENFPDKSNKD